MVSVGKVSAGQARYYLDQAGGPVTAAGALTSGVEDYYLGGPEAAGRWLGRGARALGLDGRVQDNALHHVLAGDSPITGEVLRTRGSVAGFDVTFSAPKSVSVLFGIGEPATRSAIHDAHARAVSEAFSYLERSTAFARRGAGGARRSVATGSWLPRSCIERAAAGIRSCTPMFSSRTSWGLRTDAGRRLTAASSTRTLARPAFSTRRFCERSSRAPSASSGHPSARARRRSAVSRAGSSGRSRGGGRRSKPRWNSTARPAAAPPKSPRWTHGAQRIARCGPRRSRRNGACALPGLDWTRLGSGGCSAGRHSR
jgi:TrwC relaxase